MAMSITIENDKAEQHRIPAVTGHRRADEEQNFDWPLANEAEALLRRQVQLFLEQNTFAQRLSQRMSDETGTDFFEWIDHLTMSPVQETALSEAGFVRSEHSQNKGARI